MSKRLNNSARLTAKIKHGGYGMQIGYYSYSESPDESLSQEEVEKIREHNRIILEKRAKEQRLRKNRKSAIEEKRKNKQQRKAERAQRGNDEFSKLSKDSSRITYWQAQRSRGNLDCGWECSYCRKQFSAESDFLNHLRDKESVQLVAQSNSYYYPLYRYGQMCRGFSFSDKSLKIRNIGDITFFGMCQSPTKDGKKYFMVKKHSSKTLHFSAEDSVVQIQLASGKSILVLIYNSKISADPVKNNS